MAHCGTDMSQSNTYIHHDISDTHVAMARCDIDVVMTHGDTVVMMTHSETDVAMTHCVTNVVVVTRSDTSLWMQKELQGASAKVSPCVHHPCTDSYVQLDMYR